MQQAKGGLSMKSTSRSIALMLLGLIVWTSSATAADDTEPARKEAYQLLRRGDQLRDLRDWTEAIRSYQDALGRYRVLAAAAPEWEQDYYRFRITHGEREIARIVRETGRDEAHWLGTAVVEIPQQVVEDPYRAMYEAMVEENRYLRSRIEVLEADLAMFEEMDEIEGQREFQRMENPSVIEPDPASPQQQDAPVVVVPARPVPRYPVADSGPELFPPKRD
jgi:hypothetical protein